MPIGDFERSIDSFIGGATIADAEALVAKLPPAEMGCFYLDREGRPVCPDPASPEFPKLTLKFVGIKGALPRIAEE